MIARVRPKEWRHTERVRIRPRNAPTGPRLADHIELVSPSDLKIPPGPLRSCAEDQIQDVMNSVSTFGFNVPIVIDEFGFIWSGIVRFKAAQRLGLSTIPTVRLKHLSEAQKRGFRIADNKVREKGKWDRKALAVEIPELEPLLIEEGRDISITGFSPVEIDQIMLDFEQNATEPSDDINSNLLSQIAVAQKGDVFQLDNHKLCCGDGRDEELLRQLVGNRPPAMGFLDPPYNQEVGAVVGRGRTKHAEFAMASGEMRPEEYLEFLRAALKAAAAVSLDSALHFVCIDWRHVETLIQAGRDAYAKMLNLAVWVKSTPGQGSLYRSQHELIGVFRVGKERHLNNIQLGRHGRSRSNVWPYQGANTFRAGRMEDLRSHPTVKPTAMVCDALKDCTKRNDTVIDTFCGSGTTLLAAERVGRRAIGVDIEPRFVDLAIRRWQEFTGKDAIHSASGRTFNALAAKRHRRDAEAAA